jgi:dihydropteroate synthase
LNHLTTSQTLLVNGLLLSLETPKVMGILNVTPDSFFSGSRMENEKKLLDTSGMMLADGATFLDVGGYSSRPGAGNISLQDEIQRIVPAISAIHREFPRAIISVDTFRSEVAERAINEGASLINDISGGGHDPEMLKVASRLKVPYILMHMRGTPQTMSKQTDYQNLVKEILMYFSGKIKMLQESGVGDIIIDPGFGFAKNVEQNFELLQQLDMLRVTGRPIMVGLSRKSLIWKTLGSTSEQALNGTSALHMTALQKGANILRVHDVAEAMEVVKLFNHLQKV